MLFGESWKNYITNVSRVTNDHLIAFDLAFHWGSRLSCPGCVIGMERRTKKEETMNLKPPENFREIQRCAECVHLGFYENEDASFSTYLCKLDDKNINSVEKRSFPDGTTCNRWEARG